MEDNEQDKESPLHIKLKDSSSSMKFIIPVSNVVLKINILKNESSDEDYESVTLDDIITQNDIKKLKKEYNHTINNFNVNILIKIILSKLQLIPTLLPNSDDTEKCIGYINLPNKYKLNVILNVFSIIISSITDIINNRVKLI